jgi:hypothetical protein
MKIIGKTADNFLIEASDAELAHMKGFDSTYAAGYRKPEVGDTISTAAFVSANQSVEWFMKRYYNETARHIKQSEAALARIADLYINKPADV